MRRIDVHVPQMEPFCIWDKAFTHEECDSIRQIGELEEFNKGTVGNSITDASIRDTDLVWLQPQTESSDNRWIFERYNQLAAKINFDKYQMDLQVFDGFQYSKYDVDGHYTWHNDIIVNPPNGMYRKLSFVTMLTEPSEYEGGEFEISIDGCYENSQVMKLEKGQLITFYSWLPHKVRPVTSGTRITLVTWGLGGKHK